MRNYFNLILLLLILYSCADKQENQSSQHEVPKRHTSIDTLLLELPKATDDTNKVNLLNDLSMAYSQILFDTAIKYGKEGLTLAEKLKWKPGIAQSNQNIGMGYLAKSDYPNAQKYLEQALKVNQELENKPGITRVVLNLGEVYYSQAEYNKALENYFKALKLFEELSDKNGMASAYGKIGMVYFFLYEPRTLEYLNKALEMNTALGNKDGIAENLRFIGNVHTHRLNNPRKALEYYQKALKLDEELGNKIRIARNILNIGIVYGSIDNPIKELEYKFEGLKIYKEMGEKLGVASAYGNLGWSFYFIGTDTDKTIASELNKYHVKTKRDALLLSRAYMDSSAKVFIELGMLEDETYFVISQIDSIFGNYKDAFLNFRKSVATKELLYGREKTKSIAQMQMQYEFDKKEIEAKAEQERKYIIQRNIRNSIIGGMMAALIVLVLVIRQRNRIVKEKRRSDDLLLNILPQEVAEELKTKGSAEAKHFDEVTILFTDFKDFTEISEKMTPGELVDEIHTCFKAFDLIMEKYGIEKIKTIGDSYMCAGGLPLTNKTHAFDVVKAGLEIQRFVSNRAEALTAEGKAPFHIRIGIHTGPVVAGIVGIKKFAYDIWGDTVNTASRMESNGEVGKVNISETTYALVKDKFKFTPRGKIQVKGKGELDMYFVEGSI